MAKKKRILTASQMDKLMIDLKSFRGYPKEGTEYIERYYKEHGTVVDKTKEK